MTPRFFSVLLLAGIFATVAPLRSAANPQAIKAHQNGRRLYEAEDYDAARQAFEKALALDPSDSESAQWLGRACGREAQNASLFARPGYATRSRDALEKAVALNPNNLSARSDLAAFYQAAPALLGGGLDKAQAEVAEIARRDPYLGHVRTGDLLVDDGKYPEAEKEYLAAVALFPRRAWAHERLGYFYTEGKLYDKAFAQYDTVLGNDADRLHSLYGLGRLAVLTGQRQDSGETALRRFFDLYVYWSDISYHEEKPSPARARYFLGRLLTARGDVAGARAEYEEALRLRPKMDEARKALEALPRQGQI